MATCSGGCILTAAAAQRRLVHLVKRQIRVALRNRSLMIEQDAGLEPHAAVHGARLGNARVQPYLR